MVGVEDYVAHLTHCFIIVGRDILGIGTRCLGEEHKLTWYQLEITVAIECTGIQWLGLLGMMAIMQEGLAFTAIS